MSIPWDFTVAIFEFTPNDFLNALLRHQHWSLDMSGQLTSFEVTDFAEFIQAAADHKTFVIKNMPRKQEADTTFTHRIAFGGPCST